MATSTSPERTWRRPSPASVCRSTRVSRGWARWLRAGAGGEFLEQAEPVQIEHKKTLLSATEISACTYGLAEGKLSRCARLPQSVGPDPFPSGSLHRNDSPLAIPQPYPPIPQLGSASP